MYTDSSIYLQGDPVESGGVTVTPVVHLRRRVLGAASPQGSAGIVWVTARPETIVVQPAGRAEQEIAVPAARTMQLLAAAGAVLGAGCLAAMAAARRST